MQKEEIFYQKYILQKFLIMFGFKFSLLYVCTLLCSKFGFVNKYYRVRKVRSSGSNTKCICLLLKYIPAFHTISTNWFQNAVEVFFFFCNIITYVFIPQGSKNVFIVTRISNKSAFEKGHVKYWRIKIDKLEHEHFECQIIIKFRLGAVHFWK